jgi:starvation-inducible DNA-binding protein
MAKATARERTMFATRIDLPADKRAQLIELLNQQLADTFDLYSQTKQAHWNVKGSDFYQLHELFDELAAQVLEYVDMIAERATTLGGMAMGTARMAAANSRLEEYPADAVDGLQHVEALAERYARYAATARALIDTAIEEYGDQATGDMFNDITRAIDKSLWFLEAHLQVQ